MLSCLCSSVISKIWWSPTTVRSETTLPKWPTFWSWKARGLPNNIWQVCGILPLWRPCRLFTNSAKWMPKVRALTTPIHPLESWWKSSFSSSFIKLFTPFWCWNFLFCPFFCTKKMGVQPCVYRGFCPKKGPQNLRIFKFSAACSEFSKESKFSSFSTLKIYNSQKLTLNFVDSKSQIVYIFITNLLFIYMNSYLCW